MNAERIIRVVEIPREAHPLSIYSGDPPQPLSARWAAIALVSTQLGPSYILYLLGANGQVLEALQFESMRIVLDQARALLEVETSAWSACNLETPAGDSIEPSLFVGYLPG